MGEKLKQLLDDRDMSQAELARRLGVDNSRVTSMVRAEEFHYRVVRKLAVIFNVKPEYFED